MYRYQIKDTLTSVTCSFSDTDREAGVLLQTECSTHADVEDGILLEIVGMYSP
jgi:hypothetical protein